MPTRSNMMLNSRDMLTGFFTPAKYLRSQPASELERRVGYAAGRLASGWTLLFLEQMPGADDFEFMGFSHMSGGIFGGHRNPPAGLTAEQNLSRTGVDMARIKQRVIRETFRISGPDRLAKVLPVQGPAGAMPYPQGSGIPQWKLIDGRPLPFRVAAIIQPGGVYSGNYT